MRLVAIIEFRFEICMRVTTRAHRVGRPRNRNVEGLGGWVDVATLNNYTRTHTHAHTPQGETE